jgi:PilZ domain
MPEKPSSHSSRGPGPAAPRRVRVDAGSDLATDRRSLLGTFGQRAFRVFVPPASERRGTPRHQVECLAWVGWKSWRRFTMNDALIVNLSRGGALIFLDEPPPRYRPVWVFLETPGQQTIVKAQVCAIQTTAQGQCSIRIVFDEPCPYAFFEAAVCGLTATNPRLRLAPRMRAKAGMLSNDSAG